MPIRAYAESDTEAVLDIWYEAATIAHHFLPDAFFVKERVLIASQWLPKSQTIVYEDDSGLQGVLSALGSEVGGLFVCLFVPTVSDKG